MRKYGYLTVFLICSIHAYGVVGLAWNYAGSSAWGTEGLFDYEYNPLPVNCYVALVWSLDDPSAHEHYLTSAGIASDGSEKLLNHVNTLVTGGRFHTGFQTFTNGLSGVSIHDGYLLTRIFDGSNPTNARHYAQAIIAEPELKRYVSGDPSTVYTDELWPGGMDGSNPVADIAFLIGTAPPPQVSLEVTAPPFASPEPAVATHTYDEGSVIRCFSNGLVTNVIEMTGHFIIETNDYICTGWTGYGSVPQTGSGLSTPDIVLSNNSIIAWRWEQAHRVDFNVSGSGSLNYSDGHYVDWSTFQLIASPSPGWLFMGWEGDLSGDHNTSTSTVHISRAGVVTAVFSEDADGDGLNNTQEADFGTDPRKANTDGDGHNDYQEFLAGTSGTNSNDVFCISEESDVTSGSLAFNTVHGKLYTLLICTNLSDGIWMPVPGQENIPGNGDSQVISIPTNNPSCMYQIQVSDP